MLRLNIIITHLIVCMLGHFAASYTLAEQTTEGENQSNRTEEIQPDKNPLIAALIEEIQNKRGALLATQVSMAEDPIPKVQLIGLDIRNHEFVQKKVIAHNKSIIKLTVTNHDATAEEFESFKLKRERIVPGNSGEITIPLPKLAVGTYDFFGDFHQDTAKGELVIIPYEDFLQVQKVIYRNVKTQRLDF